MIHVVTAGNQHLYARQLDEMFRMRHAYYVVGHGWAGLREEGGRETDEFDDDGAIYLLALDFQGDVAASLRLNSNAGPTLLKKLAVDYCAGPLPDELGGYDLSRWIARPQDRRGDAQRWKTDAQRELMIGLLEFCARRGVARLTMLAEHRLAERIGAYGWPIRYLGEPRTYENGKGVAVAAELGVGPEVLALTRAKTGIVASTLVEAPSHQPSTAAAAELRDIVLDIGPERLARLARAMAAAAPATNGEVHRAVEMVGTLNRVLEGFGLGLETLVQSGPAAPAASAARTASAGRSASLEGN